MSDAKEVIDALNEAIGEGAGKLAEDCVETITKLETDLSALRQELRETAGALVAMREALPPHDSCCSSLDTHERDALGRWPDCDCDLGRVLAQPLPALAARVEARLNAAQKIYESWLGQVGGCACGGGGHATYFDPADMKALAALSGDAGDEGKEG